MTRAKGAGQSREAVVIGREAATADRQRKFGSNEINATIVVKAAALCSVLSILYFFLRSPGLDEWDSVQFAMGVRSFDIARHQPHPPGFPLFIFLGWLGQRLFGANPEVSLHFISALGGGGLVAFWFLIIRAQFSEHCAWWLAASLAVTPTVWMTATKVLSDPPAAALLSGEILGAICIERRNKTWMIIATALCGAAAVAIRPQLIVIAAIIVALIPKVSAGKRGLAAGVFFVGCLCWIAPTTFAQSRTDNGPVTWHIYFDLLYDHWRSAFNEPQTFIGSGDWTVRYFALRFVSHFLGWFGIGFGFLRSWVTLVLGPIIFGAAALAYAFRCRTAADKSFWGFHLRWATIHIAIIFVFVPAASRYYLLIFPLLLVVALRGFRCLPGNWRMAAAVLPLLLFAVTASLAIPNHQDEAPPVRMVRYLQNVYPPRDRGRVMILMKSASRHFEWYAPEFRIVDAEPPPDNLSELSTGMAAIYTDDSKLPLPPGWQRTRIAHFERSQLIYPKQWRMSLYLIVPGDQ